MILMLCSLVKKIFTHDFFKGYIDNSLNVDRVRPRWEDMLEERRTSSAGTTRRTRVHLNHMENEHQFMQLSDQQSMNDTMAGMDLEDILVMEAIRLSLLTASNNNNDIR